MELVICTCPSLCTKIQMGGGGKGEESLLVLKQFPKGLREALCALILSQDPTTLYLSGPGQNSPRLHHLISTPAHFE